MPRSCIVFVAVVLAGLVPAAYAAETTAPSQAVMPAVQPVTTVPVSAPAVGTVPTPPAAAAAPANTEVAPASAPAAAATSAAPSAPTEAPEPKYAAMILGAEPQNAISSSTEDLHMVKLLLQDPMVGNYSVDEVKISPESQESLKVLAGTLKERQANASVAFLFVTGSAGKGAEAKSAADDLLGEFPGKTKVVVEDLTTPSMDKAKPTLAVTVAPSNAAPAEVEFKFTGAASKENSPASILVSAIRGDADDDRNHKITVGELATVFAEKAAAAPKYDLGALSSVVVLKYRAPSDIVKELGPDKAMDIAGEYTGNGRWVESLLMLREIRKQKITDPLYRKYSERDLLNLSVEGRYDDESRQDNISRKVDDGLDLISDILLLANLHYVKEVDNRDLFTGGARNLEVLLSNETVMEELCPKATPAVVSELTAFVKDTAEHVKQQESLTETDFQMRVKRIIMENDATVKLPDGAVVTEFIYGIPASLDPHTDYIPPRQYKEFQDDTLGHFGGLGIEITLEDIGAGQKALTVVTPLDGTPAAEAGILPGDKIVKIGDEPTEGMKLENAVAKLRGPIGTSVTITVVHKGDPAPVEVTLSRGNILLESIKGYAVDPDTGKWEYMVDPVNKIGYVRMTDFKESTPDDLEKVVRDLKEEGMKALVLDLRFNHGGLLTSGIKISDLFVPEGTIVSVRGAHTRPFVYKAHYFNTADNTPMVALINDQSASAAEILAGALHDHNRAILVGEQSFGKGTVQTLYELEHGASALKLTTAKYYTPSGVSIHKEEYSNEGGLTPDYEVPMTDEDNARLVEVWHLRGLKKGACDRILEIERDIAKKNPDYKIDDPCTFKDPQLDKALDVLKGVMSEGTKAVATDSAAKG